MRDADERGVFPEAAGACEKVAALFAAESSERFIENYEADVRSQEGSAEADTLAFSSGNERSAFAERSLEAVGEFSQNFAEIGRFDYMG